ncbi:unnamed protein product [Rotaria socialis]|uniref:Uncharacterized protein n=5 Tax=Rotaria TaxID=231623 RepID=A0A815EW18_9BILA|nr:unnamed protein product [Rotaria magnacalcarata]CAF3293277.1 unnamed protein product [Rotaria socialis]CAF4000967.1 unnamed protein product [Rotaria magnacalcarata]
MSSHRFSPSQNTHGLIPSLSHGNYPSTWHQSFSNTHISYGNSSIMTTNSSYSHLQSPINSEDSSREDIGIGRRHVYYHQPIARPHERFLNRTMDNCPEHLTSKQRSRWLKAGRKAQLNHRIVSTIEPFQSTEANYNSLTYIHGKTSENHLVGLISKMANVRLYMIDTESDRPTGNNPHTKPALLQIQAIHYETCSTVLLIEIQHLPHYSTSLFGLIQQMCSNIFSPDNKIIAWGDPIKELYSFEQFRLFDISRITKTLNLQDFFNTMWNSAHPHIQACLNRHHVMEDDCSSDEVLICLINSDDIDDDLKPQDSKADFNQCICPDEIRPYKTNNALWSLQKAIQMIFNKALDKALTMNLWSCGLDPHLNTWRTIDDKQTRHALTTYAVNDVFAPTDLYFYLMNTDISSLDTNHIINLNMIYEQPIQNLPKYFVLSDSHGKYFPPYHRTAQYQLVIKSISGLQWNNPWQQELSVNNLIESTSIKSIISTCAGIIFMVGTNSIRSWSASEIIQDIVNITQSIRSTYDHLNRKTDISICTIFPCLKTSTRFLTSNLLTSNINDYNTKLYDISNTLNFTIINFPITISHLNVDGLHIRAKHTSLIFNIILDNITCLLNKTNKIKNSQRSSEAKSRRNKRVHQRQKQQQQSHIIFRLVDTIWKLKDIKQYLRYKQIKYSGLPDIHNNKLYVQFNNSINLQHAEQCLALGEFDSSHYRIWMTHERP